MELTKWNPWIELERFRREVEDALGGTTHGHEPLSCSACVPVANIYEDANNFFIVLETPGVAKDGINLHVENGLLRIIAEKKSHFPEGVTILREECPSGNYERGFLLGDAVDVDKIGAELKEGILKVTLPRKLETKPRKIEISVN